MENDDPIKRRFRNLRQNKDKTSEEFEEYWERRQANAAPSMDLERRIERKLEEFSKDYDIDDLKINDRVLLRALMQAEIALEDYEQILYKIRQEADFSNLDIVSMDKISKIMSDLRSDISKVQTDLNITRRIRKSDKEASVVNYIESLKTRARQFYEQKSHYVLCPKCKMLVGTVWTLFPQADNKFTFVCKRDNGDGTKCNTKFTVSSAEMLKTRNTNAKDVLPESM